jgi:hypothetical protein
VCVCVERPWTSSFLKVKYGETHENNNKVNLL